ncbi:hypothetical protein [Rhodopirellula bahusiensis]|uniref:hypothetical protein n=1 Tax=Rhodopirellula bahusiensis TaxID=2014065 RepID=UPI003296AD8D
MKYSTSDLLRLTALAALVMLASRIGSFVGFVAFVLGVSLFVVDHRCRHQSQALRMIGFWVALLTYWALASVMVAYHFLTGNMSSRNLYWIVSIDDGLPILFIFWVLTSAAFGMCGLLIGHYRLEYATWRKSRA